MKAIASNLNCDKYSGVFEDLKISLCRLLMSSDWGRVRDIAANIAHDALAAICIFHLRAPLTNSTAAARRSLKKYLSRSESEKSETEYLWAFCYKDPVMQSVWQGWGGGSPTYLNARLWGRMVVVTTYKMHRFMQIMTFCLFALHNSQLGRGWRKLSNVPDRIFRNKLRKIERNLNSNSECWGGLIRYLAKDFWPKFFFF